MDLIIFIDDYNYLIIKYIIHSSHIKMKLKMIFYKNVKHLAKLTQNYETVNDL